MGRYWLGALALVVGVAHAHDWKSLGPYIGSVNDITYDAAAPATVYAGTGGAGVWRSDDGGETWRFAGNGLGGATVKWVAIDPANSSRLYAGVTVNRRPGLWRSDDQGESWSQLSPGSIGSFLNQRIAFAPSDPSQIYVPATNLHHKSSDGGATWSNFRVDGQDAYTFAVHPGDPRHLLAGGRGQAQHFSRSTDGGASWTSAGGGLPEASLSWLTIDPSAPETLYVVSGFNELFRSTDLGDSWSPLSLEVKSTADVLEFVAVGSPTTLWVATEAGMYRSRDAGSSWERIRTRHGRYVSKAVAIHPENPKVMLTASSNVGFLRSEDGGDSWSPIGTGFAGATIDAIYAGGDALFAQTSVGLFRRDGDGAWTEVSAPFDDGKAEPDGIAFDRKDANTVFAFDTSTLFRSTDGGKRWSEVDVPEPSMAQMMKGNMDTAQFKSFVQDPKNPKVLYGGSWSNSSPGSSVFRSKNGGKKWETAGDGLPNDDVSLLRSEKSGTLFAVIDDVVYRTTNDGKSWTESNAGLPGEDLEDLIVDPADTNRVFVATEVGLFRSSDEGSSWSRIENGLEGDHVRAVAAGAGKLYVGTYNGVFVSGDGGDSFTAVTGALPNDNVRAIALDGGKVFVGLYGGSVWEAAIE